MLRSQLELEYVLSDIKLCKRTDTPIWAVVIGFLPMETREQEVVGGCSDDMSAKSTWGLHLQLASQECT